MSFWQPIRSVDEVPLTRLSPDDLAKKYCIDDLPGAVVPGTQLRTILDNVEACRPISVFAEAFLERKGLAALLALASGRLAYAAFRPMALAEQQVRLATEGQRAADAEVALRRRKAEGKARIDAFFAAQQSDPAHLRRQANKRLEQRYGIGFVDPDVYSRLMQLVRSVDAGQRLMPKDVVWLSAEADAWTPELRNAYHKLEAVALTEEWERTRDPWAAINASGHWRKAENPEKALAVTESAAAAVPALGKQRSALCTTRGGAMRDLRRLTEALELGREAHRLAPDDFRPCTLLGAVNLDLGDYPNGAHWFEEAERRGAECDDIDRELNAILARASRDEREKLHAFLLSRDKHRYASVLRRSQG